MITPSSILIIGSGEFGLSTALSLALRPRFTSTAITVVDRLPFPAADGSSIDSSRIVRPDYTDAVYATLCHEAQQVWRGKVPTHPLHGVGDDGRYTEKGLVMTAEQCGSEYVDKSYETVKKLLPDLGVDCQLEQLEGVEDVRGVCKTGGTLGVRGYVNWASGWADAEESVRFLRRRVEATRKVRFSTGEVVELLEGGGKVVGALLKDGRTLRAELVVLATGAWTPGLVDLGGRSVATGQALGYLPLSPEEYESIKEMPVVFNLSTGIFFILHHSGVLKIARHASGYINPTIKTDPQTGTKRMISTPRTAVTDPSLEAPEEAKTVFYAALKEFVPHIPKRGFESTRLCWYNDTASGNFIVCHHPTKAGLFIATGGSGHAFKFLPVLGEHIVDILEQKPEARFTQKWAWPTELVGTVVTRDGSRGDDGTQLVLEEELKRSKLAAKL